MKKKDVSDLLAVYLVLFLTLTAGSSLFMFIINWEDWFYGIKLDGLPAGLYLLSNVIIGALSGIFIGKTREQTDPAEYPVYLFHCVCLHIAGVFQSAKPAKRAWLDNFLD